MTDEELREELRTAKGSGDWMRYLVSAQRAGASIQDVLMESEGEAIPLIQKYQSDLFKFASDVNAKTAEWMLNAEELPCESANQRIKNDILVWMYAVLEMPQKAREFLPGIWYTEQRRALENLLNTPTETDARLLNPLIDQTVTEYRKGEAEKAESLCRELRKGKLILAETQAATLLPMHRFRAYIDFSLILKTGITKMTDERLRAFERKFKETADPADEESWEAEAARAGLVPVGYLSGIVNDHYPDDGIQFEIHATATFDGKHININLERLLEKDVNDFVYANKYLHFLTNSHSEPTIISIGPSDELPPHIPLNEHMRAPRKIRDLPRTKHSIYRQRAPMNAYNIIAVDDRPRIAAFAPGAPLRTRLLPKGRLIDGTICAFFNKKYLAIWHGDERGYFETTPSKAKRKIPQGGGACYIENARARFCVPDDEPGSGYARPLAFEGERPRETAEASVQTELTSIPVPFESRIARAELYAPGVKNLATLYNNGGFPVIRELPRKTLKALLEAVQND